MSRLERRRGELIDWEKEFVFAGTWREPIHIQVSCTIEGGCRRVRVKTVLLHLSLVIERARAFTRGGDRRCHERRETESFA